MIQNFKFFAMIIQWSFCFVLCSLLFVYSKTIQKSRRKKRNQLFNKIEFVFISWRIPWKHYININLNINSFRSLSFHHSKQHFSLLLLLFTILLLSIYRFVFLLSLSIPTKENFIWALASFLDIDIAICCVFFIVGFIFMLLFFIFG